MAKRPQKNAESAVPLPNASSTSSDNTTKTKSNRTATLEDSSSRTQSTPDQKSKRGCGCCLAKLFVLFLIAILGVVAFALFWRLSSYQTLQQTVAEYEEAGAILEPEQLSELYAAEENAQESTQLLYQACNELNSGEFLQRSVSLPFVGKAEPPRSDDPWPERERAKKLVGQFQRSLDLLHQFGALDGHTHFPIDFSKARGLDRQSIEMMSRGFQLLLLNAEIQMREGNVEKLARGIRTALVFSNSVADLPSSDQYLRLTYDQAALQLLRRSLSFVHFDSEQLKSFQSVMYDRDYQDGLRRMLCGAQTTGNQFFIDPSGYFESQLASRAPDELPETLQNQQQIKTYLQYSPTAHEDHRMFLEAMGDYFEVLEVSWDEVRNKFAQLQERDKDRFAVRFSEHRFPFAQSLLPDYSDFGEKVQTILHRRDLLLVALAIKRFEFDKKLLPKSLTELEPEYLEAVPTDPFTGRSFVYSPRKDLFTLHNVGPNKSDEFGRGDDLLIALPRNLFDGEDPIIVELDFE